MALWIYEFHFFENNHLYDFLKNAEGNIMIEKPVVSSITEVCIVVSYGMFCCLGSFYFPDIHQDYVTGSVILCDSASTTYNKLTEYWS